MTDTNNEPKQFKEDKEKIYKIKRFHKENNV